MEHKNCIVCGRKFPLTKINRIMCENKQCRNKRIYQVRMENREPAGKEKCWICGKIFIKRNTVQVTCNSIECKKEHQRKKREERREECWKGATK